MPTLVGKPKQDTATERAVGQTRYVASIYVNRKKVWEGRGATREEAEAAARDETNRKYKGRARSTTVIRESE